MPPSISIPVKHVNLVIPEDGDNIPSDKDIKKENICDVSSEDATLNGSTDGHSFIGICSCSWMVWRHRYAMYILRACKIRKDSVERASDWLGNDAAHWGSVIRVVRQQAGFRV
jgi:hypothetical protein